MAVVTLVVLVSLVAVLVSNERRPVPGTLGRFSRAGVLRVCAVVAVVAEAVVLGAQLLG